MSSQYPRMMQDPEEQRVSLVVKASDEATEVSVLDGRLREVARGRSTLKANLSPGIFKVVARTGGTRYEKVVVLGKEKQQILFPQLPYSSALPLRNKAAPRNPECDAAIERCGKDLRVGNKASIFLFIWEPVVDAEGPDNRPRPPLAHGLTLRNADGSPFLEFGQGGAEDSKTWWAKTVSVDPGFYRLQVALANGESIEQSLFAPRGWQMQIFLRRRIYGASGPGLEGLRPDLADAAIKLRPLADVKFDPDDPEARLTDLARLGLAQHRQVLSDQALRDIALGKFRDPMLGICGAYLLLLAHPPRDGKLDDVNDYVRRLSGNEASFESLIRHLYRQFEPQEHPDVVALALSLRDAPPGIFLNPPMFRQSWMLAVEATAREPKIIPAGCVSNQIALRVLSQGPWLLWTNPGKDGAEHQQQFQEEYRDALQQALPRKPTGPPLPTADLPRADLPRTERKSYSYGTRGSMPKEKHKGEPPPPTRAPMPKERPKAEPAPTPPPPTRRPIPKAKPNDTGSLSPGLPDSREPPLNEKHRQELVQALGIPASNVQELVKEINEDKSQLVQHYPPVLRLELKEGPAGRPVSIRPKPGGIVHLKPRQEFKIHVMSRRAGFASVALLGRELGTVVRLADETPFKVSAGKSSEVPVRLQGPSREKAYLLVMVTAQPSEDALRKELKGDANQFPDHAALMDRIDRLMKRSGQQWLIISTVTLTPDQPNR